MTRLIIFLIIPFSLMAQPGSRNSSAAAIFVNSLDKAQQEKAVFSFDEMSRYEWHYFPASMVLRRGIAVKELNSTQKEHFYAMLKIHLSEKGFTRTQEIMDLENLLKALQPGSVHRIPENYFVAVYGDPADSIWGWKFSGHHVALNFTIVKNELAFAPFFFGASPAEAPDGHGKGKRIIRDEEDLGFELINSMNPRQKAKAVFQLKAFTDIVTTNAIHVAPLSATGIAAEDLNQNQKMLLNQLIAAYLSSMTQEIAIKRMKRIATEDMNQIRFGWAGGFAPGEPHYYRVQGKTFLIEFDNTQDKANHIHTVWRDFNGDYGADLLKKHYQKGHHQKK